MAMIILAMKHDSYCMAGMLHGSTALIPNALGETQTPATAYLYADGSISIGYPLPRNETHRILPGICDKNTLLETHLQVGDACFSGRDVAAALVSTVLTDAKAALGKEITRLALILPEDYSREAYLLEELLLEKNCSVRVFRIHDVAAWSYAAMHPADSEQFSVCCIGSDSIGVSYYEVEDTNGRTVRNVSRTTLCEDHVRRFKEQLTAKILVQFLESGFSLKPEQYPRAYRTASAGAERILQAEYGADAFIPENQLSGYRVPGGISFRWEDIRSIAERSITPDSSTLFEQTVCGSTVLLISTDSRSIVINTAKDIFRRSGFSTSELDFRSCIQHFFDYLEEQQNPLLTSCTTDSLSLSLADGKKLTFFKAGTPCPIQTSFDIAVPSGSTRLTVLQGYEPLLSGLYTGPGGRLRVEASISHTGLVTVSVQGGDRLLKLTCGDVERLAGGTYGNPEVADNTIAVQK